MSTDGFFDGDMRPSDREANARATFYQAREPYQPMVTYSAERGAMSDGRETDETYGPPMTDIGGVQVYTYIRDGILVVSLDFDTADPDVLATYGEGCIPVIIKASGETVWTALPENAISEDDARQLRRAGMSESGDWVLPGWAERDY